MYIHIYVLYDCDCTFLQCIYLCLYLYVYVFMYKYMCIWFYLCICVCMYVCIYMWVYVCMFICVYVCMCVCVCVCVYEFYPESNIRFGAERRWEVLAPPFWCQSVPSLSTHPALLACGFCCFRFVNSEFFNCVLQ